MNAAIIRALGLAGALAVAGCGRAALKHEPGMSALSVPPAYARQELPAERNAYPLWTNAMALAALPADKALRDAFYAASKGATNLPAGDAGQALADWLDSKKAAFALVSQGIALGKLQFPETPPRGVIGTVDLSGLLRLSNMKAIEGRRCAERGDSAQAAREFADVVKMGQMVIAGDSVEVLFLVGTGMRSVGLGRLRWLCSQEGVTADVMRDVLARLPVPEAADPCLAQAYRQEASVVFWATVNELKARADRCPEALPVRLDKVFDADDSMRLAADVYARYEANALCAWTQRDARIAEEVSRPLATSGLASNEVIDYCWDFGTNRIWRADDERARKKRWRQLEKAGRAQPNIFGRMLVTMLVESAESCLVQSFKSRTLMSLTRAFVAARIVRTETGRYPVSLAALADKGLLSDVPKDFFADRPVLYSAEKRILWSVGLDGVDDGGDEKRDLVVKLPE